MPQGQHQERPGPQPRFASLALRDIPAPDHADVIVVPLPAGASIDPELWAATIFSLRFMPVWVRAALGAREALAPLIGIPRAGRGTFAVDRVEGEEALIGVDDVHLDFRCAVGVDPLARLVRVTTAVRLHGLRGRVYFAPVRLAHPVVVRSMLRRAARVLGPGEGRDARD